MANDLKFRSYEEELCIEIKGADQLRGHFTFLCFRKCRMTGLNYKHVKRVECFKSVNKLQNTRKWFDRVSIVKDLKILQINILNVKNVQVSNQI